MTHPSPTTALLMLGSNRDALPNLRAALALLRAACTVVAVSSVYESAAEGSTAGGPPYLNAAVRVVTGQTAEAFKLDVLRTIEARLGRKRDGSAPPGDVPIDLDIALWGDTPLTYGSKPWRSPAPDMLSYAFVALPLAEIAPETLHPETGQRLAEIAAHFAASRLENLGRLLDEPGLAAL